MCGMLYISMKIDTLGVADTDENFKKCVVKDYEVLIAKNNLQEIDKRFEAFKSGPFHKIEIYRYFENFVFNSQIIAISFYIVLAKIFKKVIERRKTIDDTDPFH